MRTFVSGFVRSVRRDGRLTTYVVAVALSIGCRESIARVLDAGVVVWGGVCATEPMLPVGDSLQFIASVARPKRHDVSLNPFDGAVLYTSVTNPGAFTCNVRLPTANPSAGLDGQGKARVTPSGMLLGDEPGYVFVYASSAGSVGLSRYLVVPRVRRMTVTPQDTAIRVGDTVTVRLDAELETAWSQRYVVWHLIGHGTGTEAATTPAYDSGVDTTTRQRRFVGQRPGTAEIEVCVAGTRRDTIALRVVAP